MRRGISLAFPIVDARAKHISIVLVVALATREIVCDSGTISDLRRGNFSRAILWVECECLVEMFRRGFDAVRREKWTLKYWCCILCSVRLDRYGAHAVLHGLISLYPSALKWSLACAVPVQPGPSVPLVVG